MVASSPCLIICIRKQSVRTNVEVNSRMGDGCEGIERSLIAGNLIFHDCYKISGTSCKQ